MAALGAPRLVLMSCDPAAGARDLRALAHVQGQLALREDGGLVDLVWSFQPERTPARAAIAMGAKIARKIRKTLGNSPMPSQMMMSGR